MDETPPAISAEIPADLTINLRKTVELGGETYAQLKLREPTAAEWQQWDKLTGVEMDITAIAIVSGVPKPAVAMIGVRDLIEASRYISRFLG